MGAGEEGNPVAVMRKEERMDLTPENKEYIDGRTYFQLLSSWRFASYGSEWFSGETGDYWAKQMKELRDAPGGNAMHVEASKALV